jgi:L-malate glycosyltransferase
VRPKSILHCHSTFSLGGKETRAVRLMNMFGNAAEHTILSSVPGALSAREAIDPAIKTAFPGDAAPTLHGNPGITRYRALSRYMQKFDLVLTYNWGAMDAVGARRLFPKGCPSLIHHEDGFNADEAQRLDWKRNLFRKLTLDAANHVIVPSRRLESIATLYWGRADVIRIPNGIDLSPYTRPPKSDSIPGLRREPGDLVVGTFAGLRPVKNLPRLVRAVATLPSHVKLVIIGEGPERDAILAEAARTGVKDRLILPGFLSEPHRYISHFDIFALSSDSEQFPISLVEAMAAGLPVIATDVGDVRTMVAKEGRAFVVPPQDEARLAEKLAQLASDADLRNSLGTQNRGFAIRNYDEKTMIERYATVYGIASN